MKKTALRIASLLLLFTALVPAQNEPLSRIVSDTLLVNFENKYHFSNVAPIPGSESVKLGDRSLRDREYRVFYKDGFLKLADTLTYSMLDTLIVRYEALQLNLHKKYYRRKIVLKIDEQRGDTTYSVRRADEAFTVESVFGNRIRKSGTLVRGFTVGTNRDVSLQSGLRMELSGMLTDDIEILAALTDENTPIQPEGNTESLDELDKVFIQIKHPNAAGTFGDFDLEKRLGEFGILTRRLQGLYGEVNIGDYSGFLAAASAKGQFHSQFFQGDDGVQGPYRLAGKNGERDIIVIAGSEKVFLDGIQMKRGENNDYVIDYSNAEITFTTNRIITSISRINVDFEYSDRRFSRTILAGGAGVELFDNTLSIHLQYFTESDDKDNPIDIAISDEDRDILEQAGDNRNEAVKSGVRLAEADSLGNVRGAYAEADTLIDGEVYTFYHYQPGSPEAVYNVSFSYVGTGQGEYRKRNIGQFEYAGPGGGAYAPVIFLPLPESRQFGNMLITYTPAENFRLSLEAAGSMYDRNTFSSLDDGDNGAYARNLLLELDPTEIALGGMELGKIGLRYKDRFTQQAFSTPDRYNDVEFDRNYNLAASAVGDETLREGAVNYSPVEEVSLRSAIGYLARGNGFNSLRSNSSALVDGGEDYRLRYNADYVTTENNQLVSDWLRMTGDGFYSFGLLKPGIDFRSENRAESFDGGDSLNANSFEYIEAGPYLEVDELAGFTFRLQYTGRVDRRALNGGFRREASSTGQSLELKYSGVREFSTTLNVAFREKKYTDAFSAGNRDNETVLIRNRSILNFDRSAARGDLYYEVSTQRTSRLERVFVKVEDGQGNYIYLGDLNGNGVADENEFELTLYDGEFIAVTVPSDELFPVIDLKTGLRWKFDFDKLLGPEFLGGLVAPVRTETVVRIEENSAEEDLSKIYLLDFGSFLDEEKTLRGSQYLQQDVYVFRNSAPLNFRFRFTRNRSLTLFSGGAERGMRIERSLRSRWRMVKEITLQTDLLSSADILAAPAGSNRNRNIEGSSLTLDFSYRPSQDIEAGFVLSVGEKTDYYPATPTELNTNSQKLRVEYSIADKGRLRTEIERAELTANAAENYLPFELTGGKGIGKNYTWRVNFDYRITEYLQATASYDGRWLGRGRVIHTARAEVRAFF